MIDLSIFQEFHSLGLHAIPIGFNAETKEAIEYPRHKDDTRDKDGIPFMEDVTRWFAAMKNVNGVAIKLHPPYGMFDFDIKNTTDKAVYQKWFNSVVASNDGILKKICIESTRSGGYHVYIKYSKLDHKIPVARANGLEVISVYTGGLLSFCYPSPGYNLIHNDFSDLEELTEDEFDLMLSVAAYFNEDKDYVPYSKTVPLLSYPIEYEDICLQFDEKCTEDVFEKLVNSISLYRVTDDAKYKNKKYVPFLREGSTANYSAKVYFKAKRLLIFSASMHGFPTWHDSVKAGDGSWTLSPAKIIYYKNDKNWDRTLDEITMICDSAGIELVPKPDISDQPIIAEDRLRFPYDIFPDDIQQFISAQVIQHEYLAGAILVALSAVIGNTCELEAMDGYIVKPILYLAIIAPPGASKSPAMKKAFEPVEKEDDREFRIYAQALAEYREEHAAWKKEKSGNNAEPQKPNMPQTLIKDVTIEMVVKILTHNSQGCCIFADELSGFLNRMNQYKAGDEIQKWLEMWAGSPILLQRITREENKVPEPFCSIVGGIQPGVLERLSKEENEHNGFFHRFLFVYPVPKKKADWEQINIPGPVKEGYRSFFRGLFEMRREPERAKYRLTPAANALYKQWFDNKNIKYNNAQNDHIKGIIAKYQDYCLRFALIIQVAADRANRACSIHKDSMERAIRLTEYFLGNMHKAIKILVPETPVDKLQGNQEKLYALLPNAFTTKTAVELGKTLNMKDHAVKMFLSRGIKTLFTKKDQGSYEKIF